MMFVKIPDEITTDVAYETGVHIGDGSMGVYKRPGKIDYEISYYGHAINDWPFFADIFSSLLRKIYDVKVAPRKVKNENTCVIRFRSKMLLAYKHDVIGLPLGSKSKLSCLPSSITELSNNHIIACIRGIFDTDFSLSMLSKHKSYHYYPRIAARLSNKGLVDDICYWLNETVGIDAVSYKSMCRNKLGVAYVVYCIDLNGSKMLEEWMRKIGSNNPNHVHKYKSWKTQTRA